MTALPDYDSPLALKAFLDSSDMAMRKKFGQNFLINRMSRERLVAALELKEDCTVWEVGPGLGAMTDLILKQKAQLTAFEIDRGFCEVLKDLFNEKENFTLVEGDFLKTWKKIYAETGTPKHLFGNLPYNIAATIIGDMISDGVRFESMVVTVQKEVALRMAAKPNSKDYSSFSVLCQWAYDVSTIMDLAGGCFWPRPNVASRAVKLVRKDSWPSCESPELFMSLLRGLFSSRRKTVRNNFSAWLALQLKNEKSKDELVYSLLEEAGIDSNCRAETLALDDFLRLSNVVARL